MIVIEPETINEFTAQRSAGHETHKIRMLSKFRTDSPLLSIFILFCHRLFSHSWCLREMKLHLDNTVGGVSESLMARDVAWCRATTQHRCTRSSAARRPFFFSTLLISFFCHASRVRDEFFQLWRCPGWSRYVVAVDSKFVHSAKGHIFS